MRADAPLARGRRRGAGAVPARRRPLRGAQLHRRDGGVSARLRAHAQPRGALQHQRDARALGPLRRGPRRHARLRAPRAARRGAAAPGRGRRRPRPAPAEHRHHRDALRGRRASTCGSTGSSARSPRPAPGCGSPRDATASRSRRRTTSPRGGVRHRRRQHGITMSEPLVPERAFMAVECNVPGRGDARRRPRRGHHAHHLAAPACPRAPTTWSCAAPGYTPYETDVNSVGAGARVRAHARLGRPDAPGTRRAVSRAGQRGPTWSPSSTAAASSADGRDLVPPGRHRSASSATDFLPEEREVDLAAGQRMWLQRVDAYMGTVRRARVAGWVTFAVGALVRRRAR
jgi:hypothetical protein